MMLKFVFLIIATIFINNSEEKTNGTKYKVLVMTSPLGSTSHNIVMSGIAKGLTDHGHQVTLRCGEEHQQETIKGLTYVTFERLFKRHKNIYEFRLEYFYQFTEDLYEAINITYTDPFIVDLISQPIDPMTNKSKYDVVIIDELIHGLFLPVAHRLGVPSIAAVAFMQPMVSMWNLNVPHPFAYANYIGFEEPMGLLARTASIIQNMFYISFNNFFFYPKLDTEIRKFVPNLPSVHQLVKNVSVVFYNSHPSIQDRLPIMPFVVEIGCVHCKPAKPVPMYLDILMQSSGDAGVIYFSMGSYVGLEWMPTEFGRKLIQALGSLPQTILWKSNFSGAILPDNFRVVQWIPQQDILAHPKLRLIINNGGLLSTQEAAYHGCPILGFPIFGDHFYAMQHAKRNGFGDYLNWKTFTPKQLQRKISNMISNKKYKKAAIRASFLFKDRIVSPQQLANYWVEYVIRHNGAHFLKSNSGQLYWFQYFLIDSFILIFIIFIMSISVLYWILNHLMHLASFLRKQIPFSVHDKLD